MATPDALQHNGGYYQQQWAASEARLYAIIHSNVNGILVLDQEGMILFANPAAATLLQRPLEDLCGLPFGFPLLTGASVAMDLPRAGQLPRIVELHITTIEWEEQPAYLATLHDITAHKHAEEAFVTREQYLRAILHTTADGFWVLDLEGQIREANDTYCRMSGYTRDELLRLHIADLDALETPLHTAARIKRIIESGSEIFETRHRRKDGSVYDIEVSTSFLPSGGGQFICFGRDITERAREMKRLAQINATFLHFGSDPEENITRLTETIGHMLNADSAHYHRMDAQQLCVQSQWHLPADFPSTCPPEGHICYDIIQRNARAPSVLRHLQDSTYADSDPYVRAYGLQTYVGHPVRRGAHTLGVLCVVYRRDHCPTETDLRFLELVANAVGIEEERRRSAEALRESEIRYRTLFETMLQGVVYQDAEGYIISANPAAERILGLTFAQMRGRTSMDPRWRTIREDGSDLPGAEHASMVALRSGKSVRDFVMGVFNPRTEQYAWISVNAIPQFHPGETRPFQVYTTFMDITESKALQIRLQDYAANLQTMVTQKIHELELERAKTLHTARLASLGEMATGVAHELNQPLTALLFDADYLKTITSRALDNPAECVFTPAELYQLADNQVQDIARCRRIIDHLRAFGRASAPRTTSVDVNQVVADSFILMSERLKLHGIIVERHLADHLPLIQSDPHQLEQVLVNLISNAEHALLEMRRRITASEVVRPDFAARLTIDTFCEAQTLAIQVHDNGCGIPAEKHPYIFQPFFTTKVVGEGTGLGLSISYGIVTEMGGEVTFESQENEGTTFTVHLPLTLNSA